MGKDQGLAFTEGGDGRIRQAVEEAGFGGLYDGNDDIGLMLRRPDLTMTGKGVEHESNIFELSIVDAPPQRLRCYRGDGERPTLQYQVQLLAIDNRLTAFAFRHDGTIYGNFVDHGPDFWVDPMKRKARIRSSGGGCWVHTISFENEQGTAVVPIEVWGQFGQTSLARVELKNSQVEMWACWPAGPRQVFVRFALPVQVYGCGQGGYSKLFFGWK